MPELLDKDLMRERLKELFEGKTTREIAAEIGGVTQQSIAYYLNGSRSPKVEFLNRVAKYYNVNVEWLIGAPDAAKYPDFPGEVDPDEDIVILSRAAKKMSPEDRRKLLEMARVMFNDAFDD